MKGGCRVVTAKVVNEEVGATSHVLLPSRLLVASVQPHHKIRPPPLLRLKRKIPSFSTREEAAALLSFVRATPSLMPHASCLMAHALFVGMECLYQALLRPEVQAPSQCAERFQPHPHLVSPRSADRKISRDPSISGGRTGLLGELSAMTCIADAFPMCFPRFTEGVPQCLDVVYLFQSIGSKKFLKQLVDTLLE